MQGKMGIMLIINTLYAISDSSKDLVSIYSEAKQDSY